MTNYSIVENVIMASDSKYGDEILNGITTERYRDIIDELQESLDDIRFAGRRLPKRDEFDKMTARTRQFIQCCRENLAHDNGYSNDNIIDNMTELFSVYELEEECDMEFLMATSIIEIEAMLQELTTEMWHLRDIKEVLESIA